MRQSFWRASDGITLIELVIIVAIISTVAIFSLPMLSGTQRRLAALGKDTHNMVNLIDRARFGAMSGAADWLLTLDPNQPGGQVVLGIDDGWRGTLGAAANYREQMFDPTNDTLFNPDEIGNGALTDNEVITRYRFATNVLLMSDFGGSGDYTNFQCPTWIRFGHDGGLSSNLGIGTMIVLWLSDYEEGNPHFTMNRYLSDMAGKEEWIKPIVILPTGGVYLPLEG